MRILLVTQWFDPEPTLKGLVFARALSERGHDVRVLTGFPNYPGGTVYPGYHLRVRKDEVVDGIPVTRVILYPSHDRSSLRRMANYASFALSASAVGTVAAFPADVVYCYCPPPTAGLAATILARSARAPLVLDIQDLWPDTVAATGMLRSTALLRALGAYCRWLYERADGIAVLSAGLRDALVGRGVPPSRVRVIANWCDESAIGGGTPDHAFAERIGVAPGKMVAMVAGNLGLAQGLDTVLDAAVICRTTAPGAQIVFVGGGVDRSRLVARAQRLGLANVTFVPQQPMSAMAGVLSLADALIVHLRDDPLYAITIPSRTQAYLRAGRPIIMAMRGDAAALVERSAGGICCPPGDPRALATAIRDFTGLPREERDAMGRRGRAFYDRELSVSSGVTRFIELFEDVRKDAGERGA